MIFTKSSLRRIDKVSSDNLVIGFDLLSNLTYMSVLSIGSLPRDQIFEHCARQRFKTAVFFEYIYILARRLGFEYTRAFHLVSEKAKASNVRSLLLRFAASISSGESESEFIVQEAKTEGERYSNEYERGVENLRKWTDAYAAILISVTLIMVVSLVSAMMGSLDENFIVIMAGSLFFITSIGVYLIYKVAPVEKITYDSPQGLPRYRLMSRRLLLFLAPVGLVLALLIGSQLDLMNGFAVALLIIGGSLVPAGFYAWKDDVRVTNVDSVFPTFLRNVGDVAGSSGITLNEALKRVDSKSMGPLEPYIDRLKVRLDAHLPSSECWEAFRRETGSELINRGTHILVDGSELGGKADQVGEISSTYALKVTQLRAKRALTASTFSFLTIPMHMTMVFILVFVLGIVSSFSTKLTDASGDIFGAETAPITVPDSLRLPPGVSVPGQGELAAGMNFGLEDMTLVSQMIVLVVIILTVANALAPKFASGGDNLKIIPSLSLMAILSAAVLGIVPVATTKLFGI